MDIEQALAAELSTVVGLSAKVFPPTTPQGTEAPYLTYELGGAERTGTLQTGFDGAISKQYELNIYHSTYGNLKALMKLVIAKLKTFTNREIGTLGPYIQQVEIINEFETYEKEVLLNHGIIEINLHFEE